MKINKTRVAFGIVALVLVFFGAWWAILLFSSIGIVYFKSYIEAPVIGFITDLVYGSSLTHFVPYSFLILVIIFVLLEYIVKPRLRFYL